MAAIETINQHIKYVVTHPHYENVVLFLVFINTMVLAVDHYPIELNFVRTLDVINFFLTILFCFDMTLKVIGLGLYEYVQNSFNWFDSVIVIASIIELTYAPLPDYLLATPSEGVPSTSSITSLRSLRLLKILRLFKFKSFQALLSKVYETILSLQAFMVLLVLFLYIFTLIGLQFFANRFNKICCSIKIF